MNESQACLGHLEEAKRLGVSFSRYCREKELGLHQWSWINSTGSHLFLIMSASYAFSFRCAESIEAWRFRCRS
jgi:hypothetical protein